MIHEFPAEKAFLFGICSFLNSEDISRGWIYNYWYRNDFNQAAHVDPDRERFTNRTSSKRILGND